MADNACRGFLAIAAVRHVEVLDLPSPTVADLRLHDKIAAEW